MKLFNLAKIPILIIAFSFCTSAQNSEPRFIQLPLNKGISLNLTYDLLQDSNGFLWFATMYGLVRYDGENFVTYKYNPENSESISFNDIISLCEDKNGNIWIGTWGGGLNMFDVGNRKFTRFLHNPNDLNTVADNIIWSVCADSKGTIWIGTDSQGLQSYDPSTGLFKNIDLNLADSANVQPSIRYLFADNDNLWIGHSKGISKLNLETKSVSNFNLPETSNKSSGRFFVNSIFKDSKGNLWVGTSAGLMKYNQNEQKFVQYNSELKNSITSIAEDQSGFLWLGSSSGLVKLNSETSVFEKFTSSEAKNSIAGNLVNKILVDKSGILWTSSYNSGISKVILTPSNFKNFPDRFEKSEIASRQNVRVLTGDEKGNVYILTYDDKIQVLNSLRKENTLITLPPQKNSIVYSLVVYKNNLWIGTNGALLKYDLDKKLFESNPFPKELANEIEGKIITAVCFNTDSILWIGTYNQGLYSFNLKDKLFQHFFLSSEKNLKHADFILSIYRDSKNNLWIGTYGGVYQLNRETKKINSFVQNPDNPESLSNDYVYSTLEDSKGFIWFGTASGLNRFDPESNNFKHFYQKDGLPSDVIFGIIEEKPGTFWLSTNNGISRFDEGTNSFQNFDKDDGLQGNVFNPAAYFKSSDSTIYFGGMNGLTYFSPKELKLSEFNPGIEITSIKIKNADGEITELNPQINQIELEPDQNTIEVEFTSLDFTNPSKNQYKYKLSGESEEWIPIGTQNFVTFSKLSHGKYSFNLMGTNSDGIWSERTASFSFVIRPHFWQTWWFIPAVVLAFILIAFLVHLIILKSKISRAVEVARIREEESERIRKKTAVDFHDELGHRLTRISLLTEMIKRKVGSSFLELRPLLDQITENSAKLYDGTKDFIWAIDPQQDSLYELMIRLKDFGDEIFSSSDINFNVEGISDELQKTPLDMDWKRHLMLIFKEGMNNSLKHSKGSKVTLSSNVKDGEFELVLEDDGKGFEANKNMKGNGLKNIKRRAANLNAEIQIDTQPGAGTKLLLKGKIPIKSVNFN